MDCAVPTAERRIICEINTTPEEGALCTADFLNKRDCSAAHCSLGLQLPGLKRFVHFKKKNPFYICNSVVLTQRLELDRLNIYIYYLFLRQWALAKVIVKAGISVP